MKTIFAFGLWIISAPLLGAQLRSLSHPLGSVPPAPISRAGVIKVPVLTNPLGGIASVSSIQKGNKSNKSTVGGYVGPVYYTPNVYDDSWADISSYSNVAPAGTSYGVQPSGQPVIINQYFVTKGSSVPGEDVPDDRAAATPSASEEPANPGDLLAPAQNYYLIAYKDHSIYTALTYWIEGDTLHYVTTQNTHNQASLGLIDIDQSYKLNADHSVPFSIPGR